MSQCPRCGKRVFFAERKSSLGKDWHRQCLTCEACSKVLNPGQHAERKGIPYCEVPCYKSLFGPKLYGFGSQVESHEYSPKSQRRLSEPQSNNNRLSPLTITDKKTKSSMSSPRLAGRAPKFSQEELQSLEEKLRIHNEVHKQNFINLIEKDGQVTLEGQLRIHWGVQSDIHFKKDDSGEQTPFASRLRARRINKTRSFHSDLYADAPEPQPAPAKDPFNTLKSSGIPPKISSQALLAVKMQRGQFHTIREQKVRRRYSINGHFYRNELESIDEDETCITTSDRFTPAFGSVTQVFAASHLRSVEVIKRLLDKFKITNDPDSFSLYLVKTNGEMWPLKEDELPVMSRVDLQDPTARMFLMDRPSQPCKSNVGDRTLTTSVVADVWRPVEPEPAPEPVEKVSNELAGFLALPEAMLVGFITMFNNEQQLALDKIRSKYEGLRAHIKKLMSEKQMTQETYL